MKTFKTGDIVTVKFEDQVSSNTYIVESESEDSVLLYHPLFPICLFRFKKESLDLVYPSIRDSIDRSLEFVNKNIQYLDYNTVADYESLCMYFIVRRKLTPRQKNTLSNICGVIASIKLNNDIKAAMELIVNNVAILDDFNLMWYRNFKGLFSGQHMITSKKQRASIFNIAGFVMSELQTSNTSNGYN